jgi:hypothetical protein
LRQRRYCSVRQLEKKICEAGPADLRPDPIKLSDGIRALLNAGQIRKETPTPGLPEFYFPFDFDPLKPSDMGRRDCIVALYRSFLGLIGSKRVGKALERVIHSAATDAAPGRFTLLGDPDHPVPVGMMVSGKAVQREPDLLIVGCGRADCVLDVEAKNLREWLSASSEEVWSLIGRALRIDAVPVLITRKILFPAYYVFRQIGLLAFQIHFQYFPPELEPKVGEMRHKDGLGFSDIRCSSSPPPSLVRYFADHLPRLAPQAADNFLARKDLLSRYAIEGGLESQRVHGKQRAALFKEFEKELFGREAEEPEGDEGVYEDYYNEDYF